MMDVQLMRQIVDEVELDVVPEVVRTAALCWCAPAELDSLTYVRSSANHIYRFQQQGHLRYLRLANAGERHLSALEAELDFVRHVDQCGLATALPVASVHGRLVEEVSGRGQRYNAVVFAGLQGRQPEFDELDAAGYQAWGRSLALVHTASQTFPPHAARPNWQSELQAAVSALPAEETGLAQILSSGLDWLDSLTLPDQDYGLLHGDFELDNVLWDGERIQALDFDEATYAWYVVDFAAALQDVWLGGDSGTVTSQDRLAWFNQGYSLVRPLPEGLAEALPRVFTLVLALKVAGLLRSYATASEDAAPPWVAQMRSHHQQWLKARREILGL
jgi:Ser/Thr protein kinase RdoA (MazF antagonist)